MFPGDSGSATSTDADPAISSPTIAATYSPPVAATLDAPARRIAMSARDGMPNTSGSIRAWWTRRVEVDVDEASRSSRVTGRISRFGGGWLTGVPSGLLVVDLGPLEAAR